MVKNLPATSRFDPWVEKIPWRKELLPTPVFLPGDSHDQRSLVSYIVHGVAESDMTEQPSTQRWQEILGPSLSAFPSSSQRSGSTNPPQSRRLTARTTNKLEKVDQSLCSSGEIHLRVTIQGDDCLRRRRKNREQESLSLPQPNEHPTKSFPNIP